MKRVLFIIPSLKTGGTNSSLDALYSYLKEDYSIEVFAISHQPRDHDYSFDEVLLKQDTLLSILFSDYANQKENYKIYAFFLKTIQSLLRFIGADLGLFYARRVIKRIEEKTKFDYVVAFQEGNTTKFTSLFRNPNKIAWVHSNYDTYLSEGKSEITLYFKYRKIVCVSEYTALVFANRYPFLSEKIHSIHNLINEKKIQQLAEAMIDDSRFITDKITLLSAGRFSTVKRFREIPRVASALKNKGLKFVWYILGPLDGSNEYAAFLNNLEQFAVQDYVKWLGGKSNPYPYFKASDFYVCLSESEACPMVFKEAKALGLPIVTTDFPSSYEFILEQDGVITSFENLTETLAEVMRRSKNAFHVQPNGTSSEVLKKMHVLFK